MLELPSMPIHQGLSTAGSCDSYNLPLQPRSCSPLQSGPVCEDPDLYWAAMRSNTALETLSVLAVDQAAKLDVLSSKMKNLVQRLRGLQTLVVSSRATSIHNPMPAMATKSPSCPGTETTSLKACADSHTYSGTVQHRIESEIRAVTAQAEAVVWVLSVCGSGRNERKDVLPSPLTYKAKASVQSSHLDIGHASDVSAQKHDQSVKLSIKEARAACQSLKQKMSSTSAPHFMPHCPNEPGVAASIDWSHVAKQLHYSGPESETWGTSTHSQPESVTDCADCCSASLDSVDHYRHVEPEIAHGPYNSAAYVQMALMEGQRAACMRQGDVEGSEEEEEKEEEEPLGGYSSSSDEHDSDDEDCTAAVLEDEGGPEEWFRSTMRNRSACAHKMVASPRVSCMPVQTNPLWGTFYGGSDQERCISDATAHMVAQRAVADFKSPMTPCLHMPAVHSEPASVNHLPGASKIPSVFDSMPSSPDTPTCSKPPKMPNKATKTPKAPTRRLSLYERANLKMQAQRRDAHRGSSLGPHAGSHSGATLRSLSTAH